MTDKRPQAVFQPIVSLHTGQVTAFEALARYGDHPHASPQMIGDVDLAETMITLACEALSLWRSHSAGRDLCVHVNLTAEDLTRSGLAERLETHLATHGFTTGELKLELTEHVPLGETNAALDALQRMKASGAGLVIDDFGSGYSSLTWLHDLPADGLKIDPDLAGRLGSERGNVILAAAAQLGHALGMTVTAEGIEDLSKAQQFRALGYDQVQGFAYGRPMPAAEVPGFLEKSQALG